MFKVFIFGFALGIAGIFAALHQFPAVDQHREASIISVTPNGGNSETFHVKVPTDRIMIGAPNQENPLPPGLEWPLEAVFDGLRGELFKLRNEHDAVIGVASRIAVNDPALGPMVEWVLHFPARGSMFVRLDLSSTNSTQRTGPISAGTREFNTLSGAVSERWVPEEGDDDTLIGRIELVAAFVGEQYITEDDGLAPVEEAF